MRPESILSEMLDMVADLNGVCEDERRILYERAREAMLHVEEMRSEMVNLKDRVTELLEACRAAVFVARKVGASSLHRPKWADERDALYMIDATLSDTAPEEPTR